MLRNNYFEMNVLYIFTARGILEQISLTKGRRMNDKFAYEIALTKLQELQKELLSIELDKDALLGRERELVRQLHAWGIILEAEKLVGAPPLDADLAASLSHSREAFRETPASASTKDYGSKTNMVRTALQQAGIMGVTPKEIYERMAKAGIQVSSSFANNALFRMKEKSEVYVVGGRYVLSQFAHSRQ
jgi:hypothetical protein